MGRIEELYKGNGEEISPRLKTYARDINRGLYELYPLELIELTTNEDRCLMKLQKTSVVEMSEDKNDPNLSSDCRSQRKVFTKA